MLNHAVELHRAGKLAEAEEVCRNILRARPNDPDTLNLLGMIAGQTGRLDTAVESFRKALDRAPDRAVILSNLAEALRLQGKGAEALPLFRRAVALAPEFANGHFKLAVALLETGRPDEALSICFSGLVRHSSDANLNGLAAEILIRQQRPADAFAHLSAALDQAPGNDLHWKRLHRLLTLGHLPPDQRSKDVLLKALGHPAIRPSTIAGSVAATLCKDPTIAGLVQQAKQDGLPSGIILANSLAPLESDQLLLALMESTVVPSPPLEHLFTALRCKLLEHIGDSNEIEFSPTALRFCAALAAQAFHTDYAWFVTDGEEAHVDRLGARLTEMLRARDSDVALPLWLAIYGAYRPLHSLATIEALHELPWPTSSAPLIRIQVTEPLEERALRSQIPKITAVNDSISQMVRAQYEENPYPRWVRAEQATRTPILTLMQSIGAELSADPSFMSPDVLIAGCGTGQHALVSASFHANAKILAIDLSLSSLAYAARKTQEFGIENIEYRHGDITKLKGFKRRFHVIESSGVLHHLDDPVAGWRILTNLLYPNGLMNIGLYSEVARRSIVMGRNYIASHGYAATAADIRRFRKDIFKLPDDHPLASLKNLRDLYSISDCRDLLFHVKEHRFTIPQIKQALEELGLRFLRFSLKDTSAYRQRFPNDLRMTSLDNWHVFEQENPDTFIEMYQFWVQKR